MALCSLTLQNCNCGFVVRKNCPVALSLAFIVKMKSNFELFLMCIYMLTSSGGDSFQPELFEFDHIHFDSSLGSPVSILYGAIGTDCFKEFHFTLVEAAKEVHILQYKCICYYLLGFRLIHPI